MWQLRVEMDIYVFSNWYSDLLFFSITKLRIYIFLLFKFEGCPFFPYTITSLVYPNS